MDIEEMLEVLRKTNHQRKIPVDDKLLESIIALVVKNPLDEDRARSQDEIETILAQKSGGKKTAR